MKLGAQIILASILVAQAADVTTDTKSNSLEIPLIERHLATKEAPAANDTPAAAAAIATTSNAVDAAIDSLAEDISLLKLDDKAYWSRFLQEGSIPSQSPSQAPSVAPTRSSGSKASGSKASGKTGGSKGKTGGSKAKGRAAVAGGAGRRYRRAASKRGHTILTKLKDGARPNEWDPTV